MSAGTVLAVDDEEHILELLTYNLEKEGYHVLTAEQGEAAITLLKENSVDLLLLDWMLPGMDGIEVLKEIRSDERLQKLPVIMLTAKGDEISKVIGLEIGADDYLAKPFGIHELLARMKALLRRSRPQAVKKDGEAVTIGAVCIDRTRRLVTVEGKPVELSMKEFDLFYFLAVNRGIVFTRDMLLEKIWGYDYSGETRTVDVHIRNLRKKIEKDDNHPELIQTIRGIGYKMK